MCSATTKGARVRAVIVDEPGGPEQLRLVERPAPTPGADDLLVDVRATSVNPADAMQREGRYPPPEGASDVLGLDVAGTVGATGERVTRWSVGDRLCAVVAGGGYAEQALVPAAHALRLPDGVDWPAAGGLAEVFSTAYDNLLVRGRLAAGETVLVHGVSGGVGLAATQLAVRVGARVLGTASTAEKLSAASDVGMAAGIDYTGEDFVERVRELTDGRGVDVVLDVVGGPYLERNLACLAPEGRLVVVSVQGGTEATLSLRSIMGRRLTITGSTLRARPHDAKTAVAEGMRRDVMPGFADGALSVVIDRVFRLDEVVAAHRALAEGGHIGKIVLTVA